MVLTVARVMPGWSGRGSAARSGPSQTAFPLLIQGCVRHAGVAWAKFPQVVRESDMVGSELFYVAGSRA